MVAVIVDPSLPYDREIAAGVAQYAREVDDWQLYLELEEPLRRPDLGAWRGHGIVANFDDERIASLVTSSGLPAVAIGGGSGYHDAASGIPSIHTDDRRIGAVAAEHLLDRGFTEFGFYGVRAAPFHGWSADRAVGFRQRIETAGHRAGFATVSSMTTLFRRRLGRTPAQFRRDHQRPVARLEEGPAPGQDA